MATGRDAGIGVGQNGDSASVGGENGRRKKVELLQEAIHGLLEENRVKQQQHGEEDGYIVTRDQEEDLLLSSLLSKVCICVCFYLHISELFQAADAPDDLNYVFMSG
jgi:hypothetical protein